MINFHRVLLLLNAKRWKNRGLGITIWNKCLFNAKFPMRNQLGKGFRIEEKFIFNQSLICYCMSPLNCDACARMRRFTIFGSRNNNKSGELFSEKVKKRTKRKDVEFKFAGSLTMSDFIDMGRNCNEKNLSNAAAAILLLRSHFQLLNVCC